VCCRRGRIRADTHVGHGDPSSAAAPIVGQMCSAQRIGSSESPGNQGGLGTLKGLLASGTTCCGPEMARVTGEALTCEARDASDVKVARAVGEAGGRCAIGSRTGTWIG
jgi:hypothetical protein